MKTKFLTVLLVLALTLFVSTDIKYVWDNQEAFKPNDTAIHLAFQAIATLLVVWQSAVSYRAWMLPQTVQLMIAQNFLALLVTVVAFFFLFQRHAGAYWYSDSSNETVLVTSGLVGAIAFGGIVFFFVRRSTRLLT